MGSGVAAKPVFEAIRASKVYEQIARKLESYIADELKPGDKLPSERQLAETFKVSRNSIHDAIRSLELLGLVRPRQGAGTMVCQKTADTLLAPLASVLVQKRRQLSELIDVRKMIEPPLAALAATRVSSDQLAHLEDIVRRQQENLGRGESTVDEDSEFHYAIAQAADNSVMLKVVDIIMDLLRETRERSLLVSGRLEKSVAGHQLILASLKSRSPRAAERAMRRHINDVETMVFKQF